MHGDLDSFLKKIMAEKANMVLDEYRKPEEFVRDLYISNKDSLPRIWKIWFDGEIVFSGGICGMETDDAANDIPDIEKHLEELADLHTDNEAQKMITRSLRGVSS